ncbi:hypothetical protein E2I00_016075, partial [Balaenoptera physalus]
PGTPVNGALAAPGLERRLATSLCQTLWRSQTSAEMQGDPGMGLPSREGAPRTCAGRGTDKCRGPEVGVCLRSRKAERQEGSGRAEVGGAENVGGPCSCCPVTTDNRSKAAGLGRAQHMGDHQQSSLYSHRMSEAEDQPERGQDDGTLGLQGPKYEKRGSRDPKYQGLDDGDLGLEDQEEETSSEEVTGEEFVDAQNPEEALSALERVSRRLEELARPKRFYSEYYNNNRGGPRSWDQETHSHRPDTEPLKLCSPDRTQEALRAAGQVLVAPATLLEEWDPMPKPKPHVSDYNRLLHLARGGPFCDCTVLEQRGVWKGSPQNRGAQMPKAQSDKCVPDRDPRWEVLEVTRKAVASPRIVSLAKPKVRRDLSEGYNPYRVSPASLVARASPRLYELATPKSAWPLSLFPVKPKCNLTLHILGVHSTSNSVTFIINQPMPVA